MAICENRFTSSPSEKGTESKYEKWTLEDLPIVTPLALVNKGLKEKNKNVFFLRSYRYTSSPNKKGTERIYEIRGWVLQDFFF